MLSDELGNKDQVEAPFQDVKVFLGSSQAIIS